MLHSVRPKILHSQTPSSVLISERFKWKLIGCDKNLCINLDLLKEEVSWNNSQDYGSSKKVYCKDFTHSILKIKLLWSNTCLTINRSGHGAELLTRIPKTELNAPIHNAFLLPCNLPTAHTYFLHLSSVLPSPYQQEIGLFEQVYSAASSSQQVSEESVLRTVEVWILALQWFLTVVGLPASGINQHEEWKEWNKYTER